ncbi:hypothetical protein [Staphylococcus simulans]|uniref:hypothetical protein n=1 Tax=Staphylococcus simulans TaxID=1286 RepID=UPI0015FAA7D0|nr:hypothetical protein [Staphylococcus simulans]
MAKFKVIKDCKNKEDGQLFNAETEVNKTVKYIGDFEKRLKKAGYKLPFFERLKDE